MRRTQLKIVKIWTQVIHNFNKAQIRMHCFTHAWYRKYVSKLEMRSYWSLSVAVVGGIRLAVSWIGRWHRGLHTPGFHRQHFPVSLRKWREAATSRMTRHGIHSWTWMCGDGDLNEVGICRVISSKGVTQPGKREQEKNTNKWGFSRHQLDKCRLHNKSSTHVCLINLVMCTFPLPA